MNKIYNTLFAKLFRLVKTISKTISYAAVPWTYNWNLNNVVYLMQNTPDITNTENDVSKNRQFMVLKYHKFQLP